MMGKKVPFIGRNVVPDEFRMGCLDELTAQTGDHLSGRCASKETILGRALQTNLREDTTTLRFARGTPPATSFTAAINAALGRGELKAGAGC